MNPSSCSWPLLHHLKFMRLSGAPAHQSHVCQVMCLDRGGCGLLPGWLVEEEHSMELEFVKDIWAPGADSFELEISENRRPRV
jgi:hypothetical protein